MSARIPYDELGRKLCNRCGEHKHLAEFSVNKKAADGRAWTCKTCSREYALAYYAANSAEVRRKNDEIRKDTPIEIRRAWKQTWRHRNPDKRKAIDHTRKARKRGNGGQFTAAEWRALKSQYNYTCLCCGRCESEIKLTPDHVVPLALGGSNDITNIQPLCVSCNSSKAARHTTDYRRAVRWYNLMLWG